MWQAWINLIAGTWIFLSGFLAVNVPANYFILGIIIAIFGFWTPRKMWQGYINGIIGLWLILSGFFPALQFPAHLWIVGLIVAILGAWRAYSINTHKPAHA